MPLQFSMFIRLSRVWLLLTSWTSVCRNSKSPTPRATQTHVPLSYYAAHPLVSSPISSATSIFPLKSFNESVCKASDGKVLGFITKIKRFRRIWTGFRLLAVRVSELFSNTPVENHQFFSAFLYNLALYNHTYWKNYNLTGWNF